MSSTITKAWARDIANNDDRVKVEREAGKLLDLAI